MDIASPLREDILEKLRAGAWKSGDRLPTERALSEQFGISRTSVRKVLLDLKDRGVLRQIVGSGTYVTPQAGAHVGQLHQRDTARSTSPAELMEARAALEPAILEMVVGHATPADFERMDECCLRAEAAASFEEFEQWDGRLHEVIADAAHNSFVSSVFRLMNEVRAQGEWGMLKKRSLTAERRADYQREHRALVEALRQRDLARARECADAHLLHVRRNLLNY